MSENHKSSNSAPTDKRVENKKKDEQVEKKVEKSKQSTMEKQIDSSNLNSKKTEHKTVPPKQRNSKKEIVAKISKKPNYILIAGIIVILIPCIFLVYLLLGSHGSSNEPVEGSRFKHSLDPEISETEVTAFKDSLSLENVENIDVSLKSATFRININANDDLAQADIEALMNAAYDATVAKFPVETYFANKKNSDETITKMYDLQVTVYNYIGKTDEEKAGQIQVIRTKNAAAESDVVDVVSSPKNEEVSDNLLNPDTSQIPESEGE